MDDRTFELLEKMYAEFRAELNDLKAGQNDLRSGQNDLRSGQKKLEIILEHDIKENIRSLHDRAAGNTAKLDEHARRLETVENKLDYIAVSMNSQDKKLELIEDKVDALSEKVDRHDIKIQVIEGGRK